ncbi:tapasin-related protein isoform X1 [Apteryx mantelli]|uniref:Tapasin-related protein isoform X1 n=1 Tax=Apteryx mantelli TaxID=2696672 RepID=A0A8B7JQZ1_9AVES|nr:PREDICTED: tapasin-related protein [Apteryx mantelli mantelli]XP_025917276.1 tapasin-related protein [Apteryx rowi]
MIQELLFFCGLLGLGAGSTKDPTAAPPFQTVDIVLDCSYVGEDPRGLQGAFGDLFSKDPATLVLRDISVRDDGSLGEVTDYKVLQENADSSPRIVFEASAPLVSIPHAESLLHADCNREEVNCEISPYDFQQHGKGPCPASWFMGTLRLSSGISIALVLRGPHCSSGPEDKPDAILHPKLRIPVSKKGTVLTTVEFLSSSRSTSLRTHLGGLVTLDCHFALVPSSLLSSLEWRRQHRGSGRRLFRYQAGSTGPTVEPKVRVDLPQLLGNGDASLNLQGVSVADEGTYICLVSTPQHQIQHIIQLQVAEPPKVRVIPAQVSFERDVTTTLTCDIAGYYPLDVSVSWTQKTAEDEAEITLSSTRFSSHRQSQDGTYSITSYLSISSAAVQAPATYSCHVSHVALEEPISVSAYLKAPEKTGSEGLVGGFIATVIFVVVLFIVLRRKRTVKPKSEQLLRASE